MKFLYFFLLRRKPLGWPVVAIVPSRSIHASGGAAPSTVHCSAMSCLGIKETKPSFASSRRSNSFIGSLHTNRRRTSTIPEWIRRANPAPHIHQAYEHSLLLLPRA